MKLQVQLQHMMYYALPTSTAHMARLCLVLSLKVVLQQQQQRSANVCGMALQQLNLFDSRVS